MIKEKDILIKVDVTLKKQIQKVITYIYTLSDPVTNEIRYIGKTVNLEQRYKAHITVFNKSYKSSWIKSLIKENLLPVIDIIDIVENEDWEFWEKYWIAQFKAWGYNLTNLTDGGISPSKSTNVANKISKSRKGFEVSQETKDKISKALKGKINCPDCIKNNLHTYRTNESFTKIAKSKKGKKRSLETVEKIKMALKGKKAWNKNKKMDESFKNKIKNSRKNKKSVSKIDVQTKEILKIYSSLAEAAFENNLTYSNISSACTGRLKTSGGFLWQFNN
jgi:group I intron endonuclease